MSAKNRRILQGATGCKLDGVLSGVYKMRGV